MNIHIIHHMRTKGLKNTVYVGRPTVLGNPYTHLPTNNKADFHVGSLLEAVQNYEVWLDEQVDNGNEAVIDKLTEIYNLALTGEDIHLACWCKDELHPFKTDHEYCHADVIRNFILDELEAGD